MTPEQLQAFAPELTFAEAGRCVWLMNKISEVGNRPMPKQRVTKKARFQMPEWAWKQWRREFDKERNRQNDKGSLERTCARRWAG